MKLLTATRMKRCKRRTWRSQSDERVFRDPDFGPDNVTEILDRWVGHHAASSLSWLPPMVLCARPGPPVAQLLPLLGAPDPLSGARSDAVPGCFCECETLAFSFSPRSRLRQSKKVSSPSGEGQDSRGILAYWRTWASLSRPRKGLETRDRSGSGRSRIRCRPSCDRPDPSPGPGRDSGASAASGRPG